MQVNILFFGQIKDITGSGSLVLDNISDTESLVAKLQAQFPRLGATRYVLAVDKQVVQHNTTLQPNSTVAFMPAFSGG